MTTRRYQIARQPPGTLDTVINEVITEPDGEHATVFLALHAPASHTNAIHVAGQLGVAYENGRDDREAELLQPPCDAVTDAVRLRLLDSMLEWGRGQTDTEGAEPERFYLVPTHSDRVNGELYYEIREERYGHGRKVRIRLLIEEVTPGGHHG